MAEAIEGVDRAAEVEDRLHEALEPAGAAHRGEERGELARRGSRGLAQVPSLPDHGIGSEEGIAGLLGRIAERREGAYARVREWLECLARAGEGGRGRAQVAEHRRRLVAEAPQLHHRRPQLAQEPRETGERLLQLGAPGGRRLTDRGCLVDEGRDVFPLARQRAHDRIGVAGKPLQRAVLPSQDRKHLVRLAQRGIRTLDDLRELLPPCGEPGSEVVQDQAEAVRIGLPHDVVHEIEVHGLAVLLERQEALPLAPAALLDDLELRGRLRARSPGLRRLALQELLAKQRLRVDQAGGVLPEVLKAGVVDLHDDHCLPGLRRAVRVHGLLGEGDVQLGNGADLGARHPHLHAGRQERRVVEDAADLVPLPFRGAGAGDQNRGAGAADEEDQKDAPHGPGGTSLGSQAPLNSPSARNG